MRIYNQPNNYNYKPNFYGTIDKSLIKYTKRISDGVGISKKENVNNITLEILNRLQDFMSKTSGNIILKLERTSTQFTDYISDAPVYSLYFKNLKNKTKVRAHRPDFTINDKLPKISENGLKIVSPTLYGPKGRYIGLCVQGYEPIDVKNLKELDKWSKDLVQNIDPHDLDNFLTKSAINA